MTQPQPFKGGNPPRIIVADDHEWIRRILVDVVQETLPTAEIVATGDGLDALNAFREGGCDFLVTNHAMPNLNGAGLIREVRNRAPDMPILMVSVKPEVASEAADAGANWFLTKEQIMEHMPPLLRQYAGRAVNPGV